jgi:RHS repeat-associated protein
MMSKTACKWDGSDCTLSLSKNRCVKRTVPSAFCTQSQTSSYNYDSLNQLIFAGLEGKFELTSDPEKEDQYTGRFLEDYEGQETIEEVQNTELIELDYAAGSIGLALGGTYPVTRVELTPDSPVHRVEERNLAVYYSTNNYEYTEVAQDDYKLTIDEEGRIRIIFNQPVSARYIKVKSYFDDRDENFEPVNKAEFVNEAQDIIKVYYYVSERAENYSYDAVGNRTEETITQRYTTNIDYSYYASSSRLKERVTDDGEKTAYVYDNNGNLIKKGTGYTISGDSVIFALDGEEYWEYEYDLLDRLTSVKKNGITVASYTYNHEGLRIKKEDLDRTIYYTFGLNGEVLYEQEDTGYMEYIYVGGQHFARVDGDVISGVAATYFYHTDHLGSTVLVTTENGEIVWSTEYTPFGSITLEEGQLDFKAAIKFTGKDLDEDAGLYYYNARWYDSEVGRFISADSYKGELENPQTLNLYVYTLNNPLIYVDLTGNYAIQDMWADDIRWDETLNNHYTEQEHIDYLKSFKSFKEKYTFEGELQRYKLVFEHELGLLRTEQKIASLIPIYANSLKVLLERDVWNLVSGNSTITDNRAIESVIEDLVLGVASKYGNISQYDERLMNISTAIQESQLTYDLQKIAR